MWASGATIEPEAADGEPLQGEGVKQVLHLRTMHLGPEEVLVGMKVILDDEAAIRDATRVVDAIEERLRAELPILKRIYIEVGATVDPKATRPAS